MKKKIVIIGSGFSSLSAASYLAKKDFDVHVYEKNETLGGRARQLKKQGFTFDMGPSWYWMPDVFESFYNDFGKSTNDFYKLNRLDPGYQVVFGENEIIPIGDSLEKIYEVFEKEEAGSSQKLEKFIASAKDNYEIAIKDLVYRPGLSPLELVTTATIKKVKYFLSNIKRDVYKEFKSPKLRQILQFPVLFLGAKPSNTPSFYNFMNFADFGLGTWHPENGMYSIVQGMVSLAESLGVTFHTQSPIEKITVDASGKATGIKINGEQINADIVLSGADYHHSETLLDPKYRVYSEAYWDKKVFAPSSLLFYIGLDKKVENLAHHTLFFDVDFDEHARVIYDHPEWPKNPLFYANFPSVSDPKMAPEGKEACFLLIPIAPGIEDTPELREKYLNIVIERLEKLTNQPIKKEMLFCESFCVKDFVKEYNSYKGNAYGLANTLLQTAFLRPKLKSKKVKNLFFTGQLTVPGPGVPPALISGKLVSELISKTSL
ncbi:phytoene desaturase family protein [Flavobacteriaceae bacterium]|jgi:phytoene desaturase|nr:phytoene desaturase family protein [Flavobacteriaceae bacterium]MDA9144706.1 phytoene desaturase family protein [Flavobacteriaceae bacterium]MDA9225712.1 phytoene desaturase family protein [Flavobacteriaceae bacterium]MDA9326569.1 phytoene desaturase family protein [Flavobacteriaceae bacterium]MDA9937361.1 phytoene desaturase family protein [Flavobacteriaceae bacterium]